MPGASTVRPSPHALLPLVASRGQRFAREELQEGRTPPCSTSALRLSTVRANSGEKFWALIFGPELAMLVHVRRPRLLLTAIGSQTGFAVSIVMSSTLLVMATAAAFGILRSGEV